MPTTPADIGGGTGRFSLDLAERVRAVTHVDLSQNMLAIARQVRRGGTFATSRSSGPTLLPVPEILRDPYSSDRWILIAIHVGLVVCGIALILLPALT